MICLMHKQFRLKSRAKTYLYSGLFFILAFVAAIVFSSDRISLGMIPILKTNLVEIGIAKEEQGSVLRRTVNDVLWLPLEMGTRLYDSDTVFTGSKARFLAHIKGDFEVEVSENSLVRLGIIDGKPLIDLRAGSVRIEAKGPRSDVIMQRGIEKADTKAESSGQQATERMTESQELPSDPTPGTKVDEPPAAESEVQSSKTKTQPVKQRASKFPYPANATLLLFKKSGTLKILADDACATQCSIHLEVAGETQDRSFAKGEAPEVGLELKQGFSGKVFWSYSASGQSGSKFWFEVQPYSNDAVLRGLKEKRPVEITSF